jgi:hypothetical protein
MDNFTFNTNEIETIRIIAIIGSCFSISAAIFVFALFWFFKEIRNFNLELVLWFSLSNSLYSISNLLPYDPDNKTIWCPIQSFVLSAFQHAAMCWSCIIGYCCFMGFINKNHLEKHKKSYRILFITLSFSISFCLASM